MSIVRLLVYFIIFVVIFGALGVWIPLAQYYFLNTEGVKFDDITSNLATMVISTAILAYADSLLSLRGQNGDHRTPNLFLLGITLLAGAGGVCALTIKNGQACMTIALIGAFLASVVWFWVSVSNPNFQVIEASAPLGGPDPN